MSFKTEQEAFWQGDFGSQYIERNASDQLLASNLSFFARGLRVAGPITSMIEFGANIGMNLRALKQLYPGAAQHGIEINDEAARELATVIPADHVHHGSLLEHEVSGSFDLALIKGVLIHINPDHLNTVYDKLHASAGKYLMIAEYYNPSPVSIPYRGHEDRLFKRDFCGEVLDRFDDLKLVDYGFAYHRDPNFPQDDINWFLLQKQR